MSAALVMEEEINGLWGKAYCRWRFFFRTWIPRTGSYINNQTKPSNLF